LQVTREQTQCLGKEQYTSKHLADKVLRRRNRNGQRLNVYRCPLCRTWHHGTKPPTHKR
jgi:heterodisulfide reductase subunit B